MHIFFSAIKDRQVFNNTSLGMKSLHMDFPVATHAKQHHCDIILRAAMLYVGYCKKLLCKKQQRTVT